MRNQKENKHILLKIIILALAAFLTAVAFMDFTPTQKAVEKTIFYTDKVSSKG